jgi:putative membrane protein
VNRTETANVRRGIVGAVIASIAGALAISLLVIWLTYGGTDAGAGPPWVGGLAAVAASANSACAIALSLGWISIRRGRITRHRNFMLTAVAFSAVFFISYLVRHYYQGDTPFEGVGLNRVAYLTMLVTHIIGSVIVLALLPLSLSFAGLGRFDSHRAVNRWLLPIWFYVSVTGVLIYFILR